MSGIFSASSIPFNSSALENFVSRLLPPSRRALSAGLRCSVGEDVRFLRLFVAGDVRFCICKFVVVLQLDNDVQSHVVDLPEPTQSSPKACTPCTSAARSRRRRCAALLYARSHTSAPSRSALHPVSCWHRLAHVTQSFDTIHTAAAVYVFSALNPPPSPLLPVPRSRSDGASDQRANSPLIIEEKLSRILPNSL